MLRKILAFLWTAHLLIAQPTGRYPSTLIEDSVNIITGDCCIFTEDMEVRGAEPLSINRLFVNGTETKKYAGWKFVPHLRLYRALHHNRAIENDVFFNEPDGTTIYFDVPRNLTEKTTPLKLNVNRSLLSLSSAQRDTISGSNNIKNIKAEITKDKKEIYVTSANGCRRYYKAKKDLEKDKKRKYLLQWEDLPNGNRLIYEYHDDHKLAMVKAVNPRAENRIFSWWKIKKHPYAGGAPDYTIETSDGQRSVYTHQEHKHEDENYKYTLDVIHPHEKPVENYTYSEPGDKDGRKIEKRTFAGRQTLQFTYYKKGKNRTNWNECECKHSEDYRIDRVKEILANGKVIYTFEYGNENKDAKYTHVWDAEGNRTAYHYNALHQIVKIVRIDSKGHHINTEYYVYDTKQNKNDLIAVTLIDNHGEPITSTTYAYDDWGNIIEEKTWGQITGHNPCKIQLDAHLIPKQNGVDISTKTFEYSLDGKHLLTYEKAENGLETYYTYKENSLLLSGKFQKFNGKIRRRTFYEYNDDHFLVKEIQDDGSSKDPDCNTDVTEKHIFRTHRFKNGPFIGMPEWIEESYLNLTTKTEVPIIKTQFAYDPNRKVSEKKVYDNRNQLAYTQNYSYDVHNNLISETDPVGHIATATYNDFMKKQTFIDFDGLVTHTYDYDDLGRLWRTTHIDQDKSTKVESCFYNDKNQCTSKTDWYGNTTTFTYDPLGNLIETKLPNGTTRITEYNTLSYPTSQTDGEGFKTTIHPNIFNKPLEIHHPDGTKETYRYHLNGNLAEAIQPHGTITSYEYDYFDRVTKTTISYGDQELTKEISTYNTLHLIKKTDPLGQTITYSYDGAGRKILETDGTLTTHFGYDNLNRLSTIKTGSCTKTTHYDLLDRPRQETIRDSKNTLVSDITYGYDIFGNKTSTLTYIDGRASIEKIDYDHFSRPIRLTDPLGNPTAISYNDRHYSNGNRVLCKTETSPIGNRTITLYDILGRVDKVEMLSPFGTLLTRTTYRYDRNNNCREQIDTVTEDARSWTITTQRTYTATNKIKKLIEAHGTKEQKTTEYHYDNSGRLDSQTDPNGTVIRYTYNSLSQIATLTTTNVAYEYHYDRLGRISEVKDLVNHTTTLRSYDDQGNLEEETLGNGLTIHNDYDTEGRRTLLTLPDETTISYTYDDYHLRAVTRTNHQTTYTHELLEYDLSSNLLSETNTTHHYNLNGAHDEIHHPTLSQIVHERDRLGNIQTRSTNSTTETFTYSPLSQLTSEPNHEYTYDSLHNRTSKDNEPYTYNIANQLRSTPKEKFDYLTSGHPYLKTTSDETIDYRYDGLGRLIEASTHDWRLTFTYDSFHRCLSRTLRTANHTKHQNFLYDDTCEIGSTDENDNILELRILKDTTQAEIGSAIALELNGVTYIPIHDLQGNICGLFQDDTQIESIQYTAYGEASQPSLSPWTFRSKRYDPQLQLINFGRRHYDPSTGRFFTPDPKGFIDGLNLYAYCHNNPLNKIDLYGLNIQIEFSVNLSTVGSVLSTAGTLVGGAIYHASHQFVPIPVVREAGMFLGNLLSWNWSRPLRSPNSSLNLYPGHKPENCSILFINGILNNRDDAKLTAGKLSRSSNCLEMEYFHSTTRGFFRDVLAASWAKMGFQTEDSRRLANVIRCQIQTLKENCSNPQIFISAHSRGGAYLKNALRLLTPEERKMIHVFTYGSASLFADTGLAMLRHNIATGDLVPMLDPLNYLKARFGASTSNVNFLEGKGSFFSRHSTSGETYENQMKADVKNFLEETGVR